MTYGVIIMALKKSNSFEYKPFSKKQKKLLTWWMKQSPYSAFDMVIADGSIRSGKTVSMVDGFITWSMSTFKNKLFIIAGRSTGSLKRNVINPMLQILTAKGLEYNYNRSENYIIVGSNTYYCFGASNEASQDTLQGLTAAGALADEVALFPRSFVEQMIGRCSVEGAKLWFNCNPESPYHFIKTELIDKADEKHILHLHFTLNDNLTLSDSVKERYNRMYSGVWYRRMILGEWVIAEGLVYDMFDEERCTYDKDSRPVSLESYSQRYVAIDYGTTNPMVFLDIYDDGNTIWIDREYYYNSREVGRQKTDQQYLDDLKVFIPGEMPNAVIIDPSAASFKLLLRNSGYLVREADNEVNNGIRMVSVLLQTKRLMINKSCKNTIREFRTYAWDEKAAMEHGVEKPIKEWDHAMDAIRYFVKTMIQSWRVAIE